MKKGLLGAVLIAMIGAAAAAQPSTNECGNRGNGCGKAQVRPVGSSSAVSSSNATGGNATSSAQGGYSTSSATGGAGGNATSISQGGRGGAGGAGGQGGAGGNATGGTSSAQGGNASAQGGNAQGGSAQGGNASSNQTASTGNQSISFSGPDQLKTTGIAPDLLVNPTAPCRVGVGASAGWLGGAFGVNGSVMDEGCDAREDSRLLFNMGMKDEAIMRLCAKPEMATALGAKCPKKEEPAPVQPVGG